MGVFHLLTLTRVPLVTSVYVHGLLCVGVWDEVQRDAGESVQLLRTLTSDVFVDFFKAVSWTWGANKHAKFEQRSG
jgi:hypothetical protein